MQSELCLQLTSLLHDKSCLSNTSSAFNVSSPTQLLLNTNLVKHQHDTRAELQFQVSNNSNELIKSLQNKNSNNTKKLNDVHETHVGKVDGILIILLSVKLNVSDKNTKHTSIFIKDLERKAYLFYV